MIEDAGHQQDLPRDATAPWLARRSIERWFRQHLEAIELERATLLTSELVSNAVIHGAGQIRLRASLDAERVRVEVIDEGHGFERPFRSHDFDTADGRGLMIVDAEASQWGIHEGTTHVWVELERPGRPLGAGHDALD